MLRPHEAASSGRGAASALARQASDYGAAGGHAVDIGQQVCARVCVCVCARSVCDDEQQQSCVCVGWWRCTCAAVRNPPAQEGGAWQHAAAHTHAHAHAQAHTHTHRNTRTPQALEARDAGLEEVCRLLACPEDLARLDALREEVCVLCAWLRVVVSTACAATVRVANLRCASTHSA
jgi:hypothetical protein